MGPRQNGSQAQTQARPGLSKDLQSAWLRLRSITVESHYVHYTEHHERIFL